MHTWLAGDLESFHAAIWPGLLSSRVQSTPLVGSEAPDFTAEAVFDQEFVTLSLSQYRVRMQWSIMAALV